MIDAERKLIHEVAEFHTHGSHELKALTAAVRNPQSAPVLREMGNRILQYHDAPEIPLEVEGDRATNDPAYMALWDMSDWVLWGDPEDLFEQFRDVILPAMDADETMNAEPVVQELFLLLADKALAKVWSERESIDEYDISEDDAEAVESMVQAFAEKHGIYTEA